MLKHGDAKNHECHLCGERFKHKHNVRTHIQSVHEARREHPCPICNHAFVREDNLRQHLFRVHKDVDSRVIKYFRISKFLFFLRLWRRVSRFSLLNMWLQSYDFIQIKTAYVEA